MENKRWAVVDNATNEVVNVVSWNGESPWTPPEGCRVVQSDTLSIGDKAD